VVPVVALILRDTTLGGGGGEPMLQRRRDTTAVPKPADTLAAPRPPDSLFGRIRGAAGFGRPAMSRPTLSDRMTLKVGTPWHPGDRFVITIKGVRTVSGRAGDVQAPLIIPEERTRRRAPSDSAAADSMKARRELRDSLERRHPPEKNDSLHQKRP